MGLPTRPRHPPGLSGSLVTPGESRAAARGALWNPDRRAPLLIVWPPLPHERRWRPQLMMQALQEAERSMSQASRHVFWQQPSCLFFG